MHPFIEHGIQLKRFNQVFVYCRRMLADVTDHIKQLPDTHIIRKLSDLGHVTNLLAVTPVVADIFTVNQYFTGGRYHHTEDTFYECGLS